MRVVGVVVDFKKPSAADCRRIFVKVGLFDDIDTIFVDTYCFRKEIQSYVCLLYTSDAADDRISVDLGGGRSI